MVDVRRVGFVRVVFLAVPARMGLRHVAYRIATVGDGVTAMATNQASAYDPKWRVDGVSPRVTVINGQPVQGHVVTFVTAAGNRSEAFVPDTVGSVDAAKAIIAERARYIDGIAALTG